MKNVFAKVTVLMAAGFAVLVGATPARSETRMNVNVPFAFLAGEQIHAAGAYQIRVNADMKYVELLPMDGVATERVLLDGTYVSRADKKATAGFLQFTQYGGTYALRAVGAPGAGEGLGLARSRAEKELAKTSGGASRTSIVTVR
jgi:hypothetical protein